MKCRELMVNDWVANQYGTPIQIYSTGDNGAYANTGDTLWVFEDNEYKPEPIEITDDIMRKNNWEECDYPLPYNLHEYYYMKDESGNHLIWNSEVLSIWFDWKKDKEEGAYANIVIPIKYVHQFQQILRLAGMTDMANNFKV